MLYDRWRKIALENRKAMALRVLTSGQEWTFGQLASEAEKGSASIENFIYPRGKSVEFVFQVLRAWGSGRVLWPIDFPQELPTVPKPPRNIVHLKTTSATTGPPRVIAFTASQLMADARNIVATMGLKPEWPNLAVISLAHSYGFSNLILPLLLHAIPLILLESALPEILRQCLQSCGPCTLAGVPALWHGWHEARALTSQVRLAISAGAPLPLPLEQAVFEQSGIKIHNFYGASECGGIAYDSTERPRMDGGCVGSPMRNVTLSLNEEGCLEVRSQAVGETYWPESSPSLRQGRFQTHDLADLCQGQVYLRGRSYQKSSPLLFEFFDDRQFREFGAHPYTEVYRDIGFRVVIEP